MIKQEIEIWKPIKGFKNYQISNFGRIKSLKFNRIIGVDKKDTNDYISVSLKNDKGKIVSTTVHKLMAEVFLPKIQVNHIDGNKSNNRLDNLEWSNGSLNTKHAYKIGLVKFRRGKDARNIVTDEDTVRLIKLDRKNGLGITALTKKYNLSQGLISGIIYNINWKHITI